MAAPMTVAFLSVSAEMGGSEVSLLTLIRGLRRMAPDWRLDLVVPREGPLSRAALAAGANVHVLPFPEAFSSVGEVSSTGTGLIGRSARLVLAAPRVAGYGRRLSRLLVDLSPDVIHSNGFKLHVLGARSAPSSSALLWHMHEYIAQRPISRRLLRRYVDRCAAIVANSRSVAAEVSGSLSTGVRVETIYNAVDTDEFSPEGERAELDALSGLSPAAPGTIRVGLVATYGRWKGHTTFIEMMRRLRRDAPIRGYIVGGPLYDTTGSQYSRAELQDAVVAAGLEARVGLTGFIERPAAAYRALDVVIHASTQPEPFGLVVAEAMAAARAVVVSAAGGALELVHDGVDALTHPPGDAGALALCVTRVAEDVALRDRLGAAGRQTALRMFAPAEFTSRFMGAYREAAALKGRHVHG